ncbi:MAG: hypothetical protein GKC05_01635 [Methanomicrobiales archaeon]|nr:hypothetical protein [Methanomicrobiales archaeon]NYT20281.1 hypothetical protein [Methanomicrobiales archaeon]
MNARNLVVPASLLLLAFILVLAAGCTTPGETSGNPGSNPSGPVEKVEVFHFHRTQQCSSCITLGAYAEETVSRYFTPEVAAGRVVFGHVNVDLPENRPLVEQYGPTGSSLWIGVYTEAGFFKEENVNVWYKIGNKDEYMTYLKGVIGKRLAGDFS